MLPLDKNFGDPVTFTIDGQQRQFDIDDPVLPDWLDDTALQSGGYPYDNKIKKKIYAKELEKLQVELVKVQYWLADTGNRVVCLYEGRDAAGKGGSISAVRDYMAARRVRTVALDKPTDRERTQWYFQRYAAHLPSAGEMVLFDRSWYNRAGVEPVMGFCTEEQCEAFLDEAPQFEAALVRDGIILVKFWLAIGQTMQMKQFHQRRHDPLKIWKLSPMDIAALEKFDAYTEARDRMLARTHTAKAPWTVVRMNDKRRGRLNMIRHLLSRLDYPDKDPEVACAPDDRIVMPAPDFDGDRSLADQKERREAKESKEARDIRHGGDENG
ncbi:polyphosphate kinase 2 [Parvularcula sp. LCG005]|uniref:polyphosphate kinase 2 n=1 Tax=Parvularcula sp. LCG005 TaxID=3078805 RepID=UPI0029438F2F|nr:polyphosphate kinase 2 [Parvularcula sp. LCG005]WOI54545.1 polyphosphate kinase 2 [Parvularcula sp. LCG005]